MKINKLLIVAFCLFEVCAFAQSPQLEEKLMALKQNQAANKQKLAQYTWTETETISLKGEVKDSKVFARSFADKWSGGPDAYG